MSAEITASLSGGKLEIDGHGFHENGTVLIQITLRGTMDSLRPTVQTDGSGSFTYSVDGFCDGMPPGTYDIAASKGIPQPGAEYNDEWTDIVSVTCQGAPSPSPSPTPSPTPTPTSAPPPGPAPSPSPSPSPSPGSS